MAILHAIFEKYWHIRMRTLKIPGIPAVDMAGIVYDSEKRIHDADQKSQARLQGDTALQACLISPPRDTVHLFLWVGRQGPNTCSEGEADLQT